MDYTAYYPTLRRTSLFRGMGDADLDTLMACFSPRVRRYERGELLLLAGYETKELGIVLEGEITAAKPMPDGSAVVMTRMGPGGVFADVLAGGRNKSPVTVSAAQPCQVLYLPCEALLRPCAAMHGAHMQLLHNWLDTISAKYFALDRRLELLCCKSLRGRICLWLLEQRELAGADTFTTPLTRADLASYLNCRKKGLCSFSAAVSSCPPRKNCAARYDDCSFCFFCVIISHLWAVFPAPPIQQSVGGSYGVPASTKAAPFCVDADRRPSDHQARRPGFPVLQQGRGRI